MSTPPPDDPRSRSALSRRPFFGSLAVAFAVVSLFVAYVYAEKEIDEANEQRHLSLMLADELRQSSDDLTRMVRSYLVTGDARFKTWFFDIRNIRDGALPLPVDYHNVYWDRVIAGQPVTSETHAPASLLSRMRDAGFTETEINKLAEAKAASDTLIDTELRAMRLAEEQPADRLQAAMLLFDAHYMAAKSAIMTPIGEVMRLVDERTRLQVAFTARRAMWMRYAFVAGCVLQVWVVWRQRRVLAQLLGGPIQEVYRHLVRIGEGDFSAADTAANIPADSILGRVHETQRALAKLAAAHARNLLREQDRNHILELINTDAPATEVLTAIARSIEREQPDALCSILLLDEQGQHLLHGAGPSLPAHYNAALHGVRIGPEVGSCGAAACRRERVIVSDIEQHPWWQKWLPLAAEAGVKSCWSQPFFSANGQVLGTFAIYHRNPMEPSSEDIAQIEYAAQTTRLAVEVMQARAHMARAAKVFSHAQEGIFITDVQGHILDTNAMFTEISGYTREEVLGKNPRMFQSGKQSAAFYQQFWRTLQEQGHWSGEIWNRRKNGEIYPQHLTVSRVRASTGDTDNYIALFSDISRQKAEQAQLERYAHYDALTELPNRVLLGDRLRQAMAQHERHGRQLVVAYLDLDGFKNINDLFGHDAGDALLVEVARRMQEVLRDGDTLARIGGDEFVAVLTELENSTDAEHVLMRLLAAASSPLNLNGDLLQVSASIGATAFPRDHGDADQLLRHADQAMYQAKLTGKRRYQFFDVQDQQRSQLEHAQRDEVARALRANEFVLYFQPKVQLRTGALVGVEALVRWQHPARGLLPPGEFLPAIEQHALGLALGEWVLRSALQQMQQWLDEGNPTPVSVNVSARELGQPDYTTRLAHQLSRHPRLQPDMLELEVLESSAVDDLVNIPAIMAECRQLGVRFALDDFGTGYSSLAHLRRLPADTVKIDRSFVRDMLDNPADLAIVEGIIGLARAFDRQVVAEGIESVAIGHALIERGCMLGQGYCIARPMPAAELKRWRSQWHPDPSWLAAP